ncbi:MAG: glycosyltransferase family 2 protein [Bacteroidales bacterium]|jgi:glycosyltransferase involved in cell wall biosynthesis|nr:glycosyltransferase family 2 protein [Bacteroidales bacterium]
MGNKLYIVMPAYNEEENIRSVVEQWHPIVEKTGNGSRLVIFNDGSKDNTYQRMKELKKEYPYFVAETKPNSGHGSTCLYAYRYALQQGADYVFQTDSDGQTVPDEFWTLWEQRENYDFLIGSRKQRQDGFSRIVVTKVLQLIVKLIFGVWVKDANTPFRLMKQECLANYLTIIPADFFLSNVVITTIAVKKKQKLFWTPITFKPRQKGTNSINLKRIIKIGFKAIGDFRTINKRL